jgi:hypothetical protein
MYIMFGKVCIKCFQILFCPCTNILFIRYSCTNSYVGYIHMIIFIGVIACMTLIAHLIQTLYYMFV